MKSRCVVLLEEWFSHVFPGLVAVQDVFFSCLGCCHMTCFPPLVGVMLELCVCSCLFYFAGSELFSPFGC